MSEKTVNVRRPKGSQNIARKVRINFIRAIETYERKYSKTFSDALCDKFAEDPLGTLKAISHFCPKELNVDKTVNATVVHRIAQELPLDDIKSRAEAVERRLN